MDRERQKNGHINNLSERDSECRLKWDRCRISDCSLLSVISKAFKCTVSVISGDACKDGNAFTLETFI